MNKMKLILAGMMVVLITLPSLSASAQDADSKHEISVGYGLYPVNQFIETLGMNLISFGTLRTENSKSMGAINASYAYKFNKVFTLGLVYTYSQYSEDVFFLNTNVGSSKNSYHVIMPTVKFNWLNCNMITLYSRAAVGVSITTSTPDFKDENGKQVVSSESGATFGFQISPIGIEVGNKFAIFAEAGLGNMGSAILGFRFRF